MSIWKEYKLGDISDYINRGVTPLYSEDGVIVINQKCVRDGQVKYEQSRYTNSEKKKITEEKYLKSFDILINSTGQGTLGRVGQVKEITTPTTVDSHLTIVRIKNNINPVFMGYVLKSKQLLIEDLAEGTTGQTELSRHKVAGIPILLPDLQTQNAIAEILSSLDDKIELNNKINQELESLAQALFNLICVVDGAQDNDGWRTIKLKDVLSIKNGYAFKGMDFIESGIPVIKIKNVKAGKINFNNLSYVSENIADKAEKFKIKKYDLLITMSGNRIDGSMDTWVGKVGMFPKKGEYLLNQRVSILNLDNIKLKYYLLQLLSSEEYQYHFISNATSSGGQANISPDLIYNTEILLPPTDKIEIFDSVTSDIYSIIFNYMSENEYLIELRDTLLPKLISGELEINEINN